MTSQSTSLIIVLLVIALTAVFVSYMSAGNSSTTAPPSFSGQQMEVAELKRQIVSLERRVDVLYERQTEPRRAKEVP